MNMNMNESSVNHFKESTNFEPGHNQSFKLNYFQILSNISSNIQMYLFKIHFLLTILILHIDLMQFIK